MDTKQIKAFICVANTLNFTKAAEELYMTQSSISKIIKSLEDELGAQLFNRNPKNELTEIGKSIYQQCAQIITEAAKALNAKCSDYSGKKNSFICFSHYYI